MGMGIAKKFRCWIKREDVIQQSVVCLEFGKLAAG
jgi:hypothetical protein